MSVGVDTVQQLHDIWVRDEIYLFIYILPLCIQELLLPL